MKSMFKIMIVDDEMLVRQGIKHLLDWEQEGYQIVGEASNGVEALNRMDELSPHVILTDIVMPVMGGEQLVKVVKEKYPHIEIIVLSSFSEYDYVRSTFQSGVADYILKPKLEADYLLSVLNKTTEKMASMQMDNHQVADVGERQLLQVIEKFMAGYEASFDPSLLQTKFPYRQYAFFGLGMKHLKDTDDKLILTREVESRLSKLGLVEAVYMRLKFVNDSYLCLLNVNPERWDELVMEIRHLISGMD